MSQNNIPKDITEEQTTPIPKESNFQLIYGNREIFDNPAGEEFLRDNVKDILDLE